MNSSESNAPIPRPATRNWHQPKPPHQNESDSEPVPLRPTQPPTPGGSGTGPERALQANNNIPSRTARKPPLSPSLPASAGPDPQSPGTHDPPKSPLPLTSGSGTVPAQPPEGHRYSMKWHLLCRYATPRPSSGGGTVLEQALEAIKPTQEAPPSQLRNSATTSRNPLNVDKPRPAESPDEPPAAQAPDPDNR